MTSLLEKEVITHRFGGSTDMLLIYGKLFSNSKNGRGWGFLSSSESGSIFLVDRIFPVRKMVQDRNFLSSSKSGSIFLMDRNFPIWKMV
jgi:hypothetical protein